MALIHTTLSLALLLSGYAAWRDLRTGEIPNALTLGGLGVGSLLQLGVSCAAGHAQGMPLGPGLVALAAMRVVSGIAACALVPYLLFRRGGMGGGDVKLLAALGGLLGPTWGLEAELYAFVALALFAPVPLLVQGRLLQVLGNSAALLLNPLLPRPRRRVPAPELSAWLKFGPALWLAVALVCVRHWSAP